MARAPKNTISYVAPVEMTSISVLPDGMRAGTYVPSSTEYWVDQYGSAHQPGTLNVRLANGTNYPVYFRAIVRVSSTGTVSFVVV